MISPRFNTDAIPVPSFTVSEAVQRYLSLRLDQGMIEKSDTYRHLRKHLAERLCGAFGQWPLEDVSTDHLREFVRDLHHPRTGAPMSLLTRNHHVKDIKVFFKCSRIEGWIQRDPTEALRLVAIEEQDVNVISVRDAFEVFKANARKRAIGRLALEAFGGLRYSTAGKVSRLDIKWEDQGIEMPSNKHKSKKRKYRQGHPSNLWQWLNAVDESCWALTLRQYAEEKKEMLVMAGLRPLVLKDDEDRDRAAILRNVWRHSFASYLLALSKNFPLVAYLMQHTSQKTTQGYEGRATEQDARLYFAINPVSVLMTWEEFVAANSEPKTQPQTTSQI